ncbi:MAG: NHL repeat-containing protein, partial [Ktedonobacteraceae bacterium]|nr:NHL repeat-containing protein [Ktedonobacteraceae bacterium]
MKTGIGAGEEHAMSRRSPTALGVFLCCLLLVACATPSPTKSPAAPVSSHASATATIPSSATPAVTPTSITPKRYKARTLLRGVGRPDDLAFDRQGRLLFSDAHNGTIRRLNGDGSTTILLRGLAGPEGIVVLSDGTMIFAEQNTHRILRLAPGSTTPVLLRNLPGMPSKASCKDGVDGIAFDPTTNTLIIPDSPTGEVYRMNLDGKALTLLAKGMSRPVGAVVDAQGTIYVADECGGAVWTITKDGKTTSLGGFGMPDDVALDSQGNLWVIDLAPAIHALIRVNLHSGQRTTIASQGFIEPQGLVIDQHDTIFVADDYA